MKKFGFLLILLTACSTFACYFSNDTFKNTYIAGVNNYKPHYLKEQTFINGQYASTPITVYVKVEPVKDPINAKYGQPAGPLPITKAVLQYKVVAPEKYKSEKWITAKTLENVKWKMSFKHPVPLFGKNSLNLKGYPKDTVVLIRVYIESGICRSGDINADDIDHTDIVENREINGTTDSSWTYGNSGWRAPFVYKIKLTGKERAR